MSRVRDIANILSGGSSAIATDAEIPSYIAGKNFIINGGMDIWQRGVSISSLSGSPQVYTADRWWYSNTLNITGTVSRQATGDATNLPGIQYCARVQRTAGNTGVNPLYFCQEIETINSIPLSGKTVTVSFYARKGANYSETNSNLIFQLRSGTGVDQNCYSGFTNSTNIIQNQSSTLTTSWQRFSYSVLVPSTSTQLGAFFYYGAQGTAGAADYFEITGVQLEIGSVATPFSRAGGTVQAELAACHRYYWQTTSSPNGAVTLMTGGLASGTTNVAQSYCALPSPMRSIPTASINTTNLQFWDATGGGSSYSVGAINGQHSSIYQGTLNITSSGLTNNNRYSLLALSGSTGYVAFSAEL
jgi:hypothetical protein